MTTRFSILLFLTLVVACSFGQGNHDSLFVFVGKKISIKEIKQPKPAQNEIFFYSKYKSKYKVIQNVYNKFESKTIEFYDFSHLGMRELSTSEYALLFIYRHDGKLYHIRFQFFDVYKTTNGRWASCGDPFYFDEKFRDSVKTPIQVVSLDFSKPVTFKINPARDSSTIRNIFPEPYFKVDGQVATGLMGCYVEDLFIVKKEGILKQLGYFR